MLCRSKLRHRRACAELGRICAGGGACDEVSMSASSWNNAQTQASSWVDPSVTLCGAVFDQTSVNCFQVMGWLWVVVNMWTIWTKAVESGYRNLSQHLSRTDTRKSRETLIQDSLPLCLALKGTSRIRSESVDHCTAAFCGFTRAEDFKLFWGMYHLLTSTDRELRSPWLNYWSLWWLWVVFSLRDILDV
jgi:hypothetical protein